MTLAGEGKNLGSIAPKVITSHHSTSGTKIEAAINPHVIEDGISSASRQNVVDRRDWAGLVVRFVGLVGALDGLMVLW